MATDLLGGIVPSAGTGGASTVPGKSATLGSLGSQRDQFLKLLLAQLKHQDPLNTSDPEKFTAQMTSFGQLEQMFNLNETMSKMSSMQGAADRFQTVALIGKEMEAQDNVVRMADGKPEGKIGVKLEQDARAVQVQIQNGHGHALRTLTFEHQPAGVNYYAFDGKTDDGTDLADGAYTIAVSAMTIDDKPVTAVPMIRGRVDGVRFEPEGPMVEMQGRLLAMHQVTAVHEMK